MLTSLNRSFSKIPLLIGGSHTQNSRCFPFTNPLETFGNILANLSQHYTDYQYYTKQKIVQAWEHRLSSVPRTEVLALPIKVEQTTPEPTPI